jgi:hypothetical protein
MRNREELIENIIQYVKSAPDERVQAYHRKIKNDWLKNFIMDRKIDGGMSKDLEILSTCKFVDKWFTIIDYAVHWDSHIGRDKMYKSPINATTLLTIAGVELSNTNRTQCSALMRVLGWKNSCRGFDGVSMRSFMPKKERRMWTPLSYKKLLLTLAENSLSQVIVKELKSCGTV